MKFCLIIKENCRKQITSYIYIYPQIIIIVNVWIKCQIFSWEIKSLKTWALILGGKLTKQLKANYYAIQKTSKAVIYLIFNAWNEFWWSNWVVSFMKKCLNKVTEVSVWIDIPAKVLFIILDSIIPAMKNYFVVQLFLSIRYA